jgi:hypothetical protein
LESFIGILALCLIIEVAVPNSIPARLAILSNFAPPAYQMTFLDS